MLGCFRTSKHGRRLIQALVTTQRCRKSSTSTQLEGMVVAPFTAFDSKGELEDSLYERCVQYFEKSHFNGMFVNGTLGEGMNLSNKERMHVAEKWKQAADRMFIILHVGAGNLKDTQELFKFYDLLPRGHKDYGQQVSEQLVSYLEKVAEVAPDTPLFFYEYAQTTNVHLNMPRFLDLATSRLPTLHGIKHTTPDLNSALTCSMVHYGRYKIFYGTEALYLPTLSLGLTDVITFPYMGKCFYQIRAAYEKGEMKIAQELQQKAQALTNILQRHGSSVAAAKAMFEIVSGIHVGPPRLPLMEISSQTRDNIKRDLEHEGFWSHQTFTEEEFDTILLTY